MKFLKKAWNGLSGFCKKAANKVSEFFSKPSKAVKPKQAMTIAAVTVPALVLSTNAQADMSASVTSAIAEFTNVNSAIPVVGAAFLLALGILAAWKLIRGAF